MKTWNRIALFFVVIYSVIIILNTYLSNYDRIQSNVFYFLLNGFAYIVTVMEMEKDKERMNNL